MSRLPITKPPQQPVGSSRPQPHQMVPQPTGVPWWANGGTHQGQPKGGSSRPVQAQAAQPQTAQPQQIQTSIQPQQMFSPDFTQQQGNLWTALATPARGDIAGGYNRQGLSMQSPALQYGMGADWGRQMAGAQMLGPQIAQQHQFANLGQVLQGQVAREQEAQQWGGLSAEQQGLNDYMGRVQQSNVLMMLLGQQPWT